MAIVFYLDFYRFFAAVSTFVDTNLVLNDFILLPHSIEQQLWYDD